MLEGLFRWLSGAYLVAEVYPLRIPEDVPNEREMPEKTRGNFTGRSERFEYKTIFYDAFHDGEKVRLIGPPLLNLWGEVQAATITIDGFPVIPVLNDIDKTQDSWVARNGSSLRVVSGGWHASCAISGHQREIFKGRRVIMTMSKDNPLEWIADWATFYNRVHGVDGVLFYENNSTKYKAEDVLQALRKCPGIKTAVVVRWPFKYGPQGEIKGAGGGAGYSQVSMLSHARFKYLEEASGVVNVDIDELVVTNDGRSLFDHLDEQESGILLMPGRYIEDRQTDDLPRFTDFNEWIPDAKPSPAKWAVVPHRIPDHSVWAVHGVNETKLRIRPSQRVIFRHFLGMTTNWHPLRVALKSKHEGARAVDQHLVRDLKRAFG